FLRRDFLLRVGRRRADHRRDHGRESDARAARDERMAVRGLARRRARDGDEGRARGVDRRGRAEVDREDVLAACHPLRRSRTADPPRYPECPRNSWHRLNVTNLVSGNSEERKAAIKFIVCLGAVSLFADMTYEGAYSIMGGYLKDLGATAAEVGIIAGLGEM